MTPSTRTLAVFAAAAAAALAQAPSPKAEAILDKYIEVTGGRAAYEKMHTQVLSGAIEFVGQGVKGTVTIYRAQPNRSYSLVELEGIGKMEEGVAGDVAWANSPMQGPRLKEGAEKVLSMRAAAFNADARWRDHYKSADLAGVEDVGGKPCYKLFLEATEEGADQTRWYEQSSNLLVKMTATLETQMGKVPFETTLGDYRRVDGVLAAHTLGQKVMGQEFLIKLSRIEINAEIDPKRFEPPAEVKALLK